MQADHNGQPSATNKSEGTGMPSNFTDEKLQQDAELTEKYTNEAGDEIAEGVRTNNPNRNTDKVDATNAGGYKN